MESGLTSGIFNLSVYTFRDLIALQNVGWATFYHSYGS